MPAVDHSPFYPNETHDQVAAEIEDYVNRLSDSDIWLRENRPVFKWGGSSMIEDRGEIFPALKLTLATQAS